ncbi:MAG: LSm family protein [Deltaproteobacteria bacterium]|nr:LSm family protein [Deltaproteobacteria bacterium]
MIPFMGAALMMASSPAWAEVIYLKSGETIRGKIVAFDQQTVTVDSERGFGTLQINRDDITMIEFDSAQRSPARTMGLGYLHRSTALGSAASVGDYGLDSLSIKYWIGDTSAMDFLVGFFSSSQGTTTKLDIFSVELRYYNVFKRNGNLDLYWGLGGGFMNVNDTTRSLNAAGVSVRGVLGAEIFFPSMPNLGISTEIGMGAQTLGNITTTNISTTTFPNFSMRYYF